ncbi:MAG: PKD domain-containing protein [Flammeovirgaceae bacterium]
MIYTYKHQLLIGCAFLALLGLFGNGQFPKKQVECQAQAVFAKSTAPFKTYSKDDYCILVDISESLDKNSPPTTFQWLTGDGQRKQGVSFEHCYKKPERYQLTLLATSIVNQIKLVDTSYYQVDVADFAIIEAKALGSLQYYFSARDSNLGQQVNITNYYWDFGDGAYACTQTGPIATHQFPKIGTYQLRLIVVGKTPSGEEKKVFSKKTIKVTQ